MIIITIIGGLLVYAGCGLLAVILCTPKHQPLGDGQGVFLLSGGIFSLACVLYQKGKNRWRKI